MLCADLVVLIDVSLNNVETAIKYCTLPRNGDQLNPTRRRPVSMTGKTFFYFPNFLVFIHSPIVSSVVFIQDFVFYLAMYSSGTLRNTLLRRGSMQNNKPAPPIRRTSSITNTNRPLTPVNTEENLPPPPAFLLEPQQSPKNPPSPSKLNNSCRS